jgi:hypothetical protein
VGNSYGRKQAQYDHNYKNLQKNPGYLFFLHIFTDFPLALILP